MEAKDELGERLTCVHRFVYHRNRQLGARLSSEELGDLAQDVVAVVWRKLGEYDGRASLETWIFRICSLETMNFLRKDRRHSSRFVDAGVDEDGNKSMDWIVDPESQKSTNQDFDDLYRGMSLLSTDDQLILRRKHYGRQSFVEIGVAMGLQPSGAKHHYYRAVRRLRSILEQAPNQESSPPKPRS